MFCKQCGTENEEGVKFCKKCGAELVEPQTDSATQPAPTPEPAPVAQPASVNEVTSQPAPTTQAPTQEKGSATQAWADIRKEGKWFSKSLLLALIMLVPILNFCAIGFIWGLSKAKLTNSASCYPEKIVSGETFKNGFFCFVIGLIFGCVYWVLSLIPAIGTLLAVAGAIFLVAVSSFMYLRVANGSFGCAFRLGNVFNGYGKQFGKALGTNVLPSLIMFAIGFGFFLIYITILFVIAANAFNTVLVVVQNVSVHAAYIYDPMFWIGKLGPALTGFIILTIIFAFICNILGALFGMILARANAIHVQRYIPEWIEEFEAVKVAKAQIQ